MYIFVTEPKTNEQCSKKIMMMKSLLSFLKRNQAHSVTPSRMNNLSLRYHKKYFVKFLDNLFDCKFYRNYPCKYTDAGGMFSGSTWNTSIYIINLDCIRSDNDVIFIIIHNNIVYLPQKYYDEIIEVFPMEFKEFEMYLLRYFSHVMSLYSHSYPYINSIEIVHNPHRALDKILYQESQNKNRQIQTL